MNKLFENQITLTASPRLPFYSWEPNKFVTWAECHLALSQIHVGSSNAPYTSAIACLFVYSDFQALFITHTQSYHSLN